MRDSSGLKRFEGTFLREGVNEESSNNNNRIRVDRERGWEIIVARGTGAKERCKPRDTRLFEMEACRKTALLGRNHARLSTKPSRSQQNLRNGGTTRGGCVAAPRVATTSCYYVRKHVGKKVVAGHVLVGKIIFESLEFLKQNRIEITSWNFRLEIVSLQWNLFNFGK